MANWEEELKTKISSVLGHNLQLDGFDLIDLVAVPRKSDRAIQLRTLQDAMADFEGSQGTDGLGYLLQIRPKKVTTDQIQGELDAKNKIQTRPITEVIYTDSGTLNTALLFENARLLMRNKETALARNILRTLARSGDKPAEALLAIAETYEQEGHLEEAKSYLEESIAYQPSGRAIQKLAKTFCELKKHREAAETAERGLLLKEISEDVKRSLHYLAASEWAQVPSTGENIWTKVEGHYRELLKSDPQSETLRIQLATQCLKLGKVGESKKIFRECVAINPCSEPGLFGLGQVALQENDLRAAHDYFASALEINIQQIQAIYHVVRLAYQIKSYATAARLLEEYFAVAPMDINLLYSLAGLQFHLGRIPEALRTAARVMVIKPDHQGARELQKKINNLSRRTDDHTGKTQR